MNNIDELRREAILKRLPRFFNLTSEHIKIVESAISYTKYPITKEHSTCEQFPDLFLKFNLEELTSVMKYLCEEKHINSFKVEDEWYMVKREIDQELKDLSKAP